jgi:threonine/homoserine/homoserine lactone efflux protein
MLGTHDLWAFLLASFLLWITPGPDNMYILARSIAQGRRAGIVSALGIGSGVLVHTLAAALGLSAILAASSWAFLAVKVAGAAYLIYLGVAALRRPVAPLVAPTLDIVSGWRVYRQGVLSNILNPKVAVFFLAFLPQFVDPGRGGGPLPFLVLGGLFVIGGTLWCVLFALGAATATSTLRRSPRLLVWLERLSGCVYIALGLNLLRSRPQSA